MKKKSKKSRFSLTRSTSFRSVCTEYVTSKSSISFSDDFGQEIPKDEWPLIVKNVRKLSEKPITVMLVGEGAVGKTSILYRYIHNVFIEEKYDPTIEEYMPGNVELFGCSFDITFCDTAGQKEYHDFVDKNVHKADIVIFVVSPDSKTSISWVRANFNKWGKGQLIKHTALPVLIMNKMDLVKKEHIRNKKKIEELSEVFKTPLYKVSALCNNNVHDSIEDIISRWIIMVYLSSPRSPRKRKIKCILQ
jgi:small GTP-binding protein